MQSLHQYLTVEVLLNLFLDTTNTSNEVESDNLNWSDDTCPIIRLIEILSNQLLFYYLIGNRHRDENIHEIDSKNFQYFRIPSFA